MQRNEWLLLITTGLVLGLLGTMFGYFIGAYFGYIVGYEEGIDNGVDYANCLIENDPTPYAEEWDQELVDDCWQKHTYTEYGT